MNQYIKNSIATLLVENVQKWDTIAVTYLASIGHLFDQNGIVAEVGSVHGW